MIKVQQSVQVYELDGKEIPCLLQDKGEAVIIRLLDKCILGISPNVVLGPDEIAFIVSEIVAMSEGRLQDDPNEH